MPKRRRAAGRRNSAGKGKPVTAENRSRLRKWAIVLLRIAGIGALTAALVLTAAAALIFTPPPEPMERFSAADAELQQRLFSKVSREVFNRRPPIESEIRLTPAEVNSLLRFLVFSVTAAEQFGSIDRRYAEMIRRKLKRQRP